MGKGIWILVAGLACGVRGQFAGPGCKEPAAADFRATELFNRTGANAPGLTEPGLEEPVQMALRGIRAGDTLARVDIYFVQRLGAVKRYDGGTRKITTLGTIPVWGKVDNGLMGLALHPDFDRNKWIYFWYSPNQLVGQNRLLRLTRITLGGDGKLDMASEKILIQILGSRSDAFHSGGPMQFDAYGDLWVTVGNNSIDLDPQALNVLSRTDSSHSAEWGPSNTASLRGGIFRIHPDSSAKGYSVPRGNFGEYWAAEFEKQGKAALAAQYRDTAKVRPEVYVKGSRSNYSITLHPTKRWVAWGEVNYSSTNEEYNLVANPVFAGYPYFHADNAPTGAHGKSAAAPVNESPMNSGVRELPPAVPGTINNLINVAVTGPLYIFDPSLRSDTKFPPGFHLSWITFGWLASQMHIHSLDTVALKPRQTLRVDNAFLSAAKLRNPLHALYGPEGALYILNYDGRYTTLNPGVTRVDYVGACKVPVSARVPLPAPLPDIALTQPGLSVREPGEHVLMLRDLAGKVRTRIRGAGPATYPVADLRKSARQGREVLVLTVSTAAGGADFRLPPP